MTKRTALAIAGAALLLVSRPAEAEVAPQYKIWEDFAAIAAMPNMPEQLGVIEGIWRQEDGSYTVSSKLCDINLRIVREGPKDSQGKPMPGRSRIVRIDTEPKVCQ